MKLDNLADKLQILEIDGFIATNTDKFASEYIADSDKRIKFLTEFSGSRATLLVLKDKGVIFVDSRYTRQANNEVHDKRIEIIEISNDLSSKQQISQWISNNCPKGSKIGYDAWLFNGLSIEKLNEIFNPCEVTLTPVSNPIDMIWENKPKQQYNPIYDYDLKYAGVEFNEKIQELRTQIDAKNGDYFLLTSLESIAWLFNLRGSDLPSTPVFYSIAVIGKDTATLYTGSDVKKSGIEVKNIDTFLDDLKLINKNKILVDYSKTPLAITLNLENIIKATDYCKTLKSQKNETELAGAKIANLKDSACFIKLFNWIDKVSNKSDIFEMDVVDKLEEFRSKMDNYKGQSFTTICGIDSNGGIVHYSPSRDSKENLSGKIMLLDAGGQYLEGTTDMTRTISLDKNPTKKQKESYTLVLKGHLAVNRAIISTTQTADILDELARRFLIEKGLDYGHATGHGVGAFLCVHEDPPYVVKEYKQELKEGMIFSNEPGYYCDDFGIRIENIIKTIKTENNFKFKSLNLVPYDKNLIEISMLDNIEKKQINDYHKQIIEKLAPLLEKSELDWLCNACEEIN